MHCIAAVHVVGVMIFPKTMKYAASPRKIYKSGAIVGEVAGGILPESVFVACFFSPRYAS